MTMCILKKVNGRPKERDHCCNVIGPSVSCIDLIGLKEYYFHLDIKMNSLMHGVESFLISLITFPCYEKLFLQYEMDDTCLLLLFSKGLGYIIILGAFLLKIPQILKILKAKDVIGLSAPSFYLEVIIFLSNSIYNYLKGYPLSTWGENIIILFQNIFLVLLLWKFSTPVMTTSYGLLMIILFISIGYSFLHVPEEYQWILVSVGIPLSILAKVPQIITNHVQGHTYVELVYNYININIIYSYL